VVKQAANIGWPYAHIANGPSGIDQRPVRQGAEKLYGIEQIGFAHPIGADHTRKRPEAYVYVY
jgi:hypothetical protein